MARVLRPLSLGQLLDETFNLYRRNFLLFVGISAIPNLALLALQLIAEVAGSNARGAVELTSSLGGIVSSLFVVPIATAATTLAVSDLYLENPTSISACFSRLSGKVGPVIFVSFITGLIVGLGTLLCVIPGIYLAGKYGVATPAVVLENIPGGDALRRSGELTRDSIGRVILVYFLTVIFAFLMAVALMTGVEALSWLQDGSFAKNAVEDIVSTLSTMVFAPVTAIALALIYYDLRVRKEAFDIDHMMRMMNVDKLSAGS
ncbi:MAG TPA: hypothetical protein VIB39_00400 [Candidatus Angelobacter sp.]|jgi:hypothetical protein